MKQYRLHRQQPRPAGRSCSRSLLILLPLCAGLLSAPGCRGVFSMGHFAQPGKGTSSPSLTSAVDEHLEGGVETPPAPPADNLPPSPSPADAAPQVEYAAASAAPPAAATLLAVPYTAPGAAAPGAPSAAATASWLPSPRDSGQHVAECLALDFEWEMNLARQLEVSGQYAAAAHICRRLVDWFPNRYEPFYRLAMIAERESRYADAVALYRRAIQLEKNDAGLFNDLGCCLLWHGEAEKAEAALLTAILLAPADVQFRRNLGMAQACQGRYEDALAQLRYGSNEADAFYLLAPILASQGDMQGVRDCYRLALEADPRHEPARRGLELLDGQGPLLAPPRTVSSAAGEPLAGSASSSTAHPADYGRVRPVSHTAPLAGN